MVKKKNLSIFVYESFKQFLEVVLGLGVINRWYTLFDYRVYMLSLKSRD